MNDTPIRQWKVTSTALMLLGLNACDSTSPAESGAKPVPTPVTPEYSLGGSVTGLKGALNLTLDVDGQQEPLSLVGNQSFTFKTALHNGDSYQLSIDKQPDLHSCEIPAGNGQVEGANVHLEVRCSARSASLKLDLNDPKTFHFSWDEATTDATHYRLYEDPDGAEGTAELILLEGFPTTATSFDLTVPLYARLNAEYLLASCNGPSEAAICVDDQVLRIDPSAANLNHLVKSIGYIKASNTGTDKFGFSVSLNQDGTVLAIGAPNESSPEKTVINEVGQPNIDQDGANASGAVYLFRKGPNGWQQQAYLKAKNSGAGDAFGQAVSLNADGTVLAVGGPEEDSPDTGVGDDQSQLDPSEFYNSGAVYLFSLGADNKWRQQAYIKASNTGQDDNFGWAVSLNAAGSVLAVGAVAEDSSHQGVVNQIGEPTQDQGGASGSGAVYLFTQDASDNSWQQQAYFKASNGGSRDRFGHSVSLNGAGNLLAVGAVEEDNDSNEVINAIGQPVEDKGQAGRVGAVYLFRQQQDDWQQQAYFKASNAEARDGFGASVSLNAAGTVLAVGAYNEDSPDRGVSTGQIAADNGQAVDSGAVYLFADLDNVWQPQAYIKANNTAADSLFGARVSLSNDGRRLVVSASDNIDVGLAEPGGGSGLHLTEASNQASAMNAGAAYSYVYGGVPEQWRFESYIKAANTENFDFFGTGLSLSGDGLTLAIGADAEKSAARGVGGLLPLENGEALTAPQSDNSVANAGAVYLY